MGFMDKLRAELIDIVEWVDDSRHTIVWRFPRYQNEIKNGAQLIVRPGQQAVFVHRGQIADVFEPGHYRLEATNLPVLSTLAGWKYGFNSPFKAEVYFVNTRQIADLKWGTPNPVIMRDPDFGQVRVRAFGTYSLRAGNPTVLLQELVGTDSSFEADEISEMLRAIVAQAFTDVVASSEIAVLDLASSYGELCEQLRLEVLARIDDEYGLEIPLMTIVNVSLPPEVEKALDARTSMEVVGDMGRYQAFQLGKALPEMAAGEAGGIAGAGMGVGMGMGMASQMMGGNMRPMNGPSMTPGPQTPPPPPAPSWHLVENGQSVGPMTAGQMVEMASAGRLRPDTLVWMAGMPDWVAAAQLPQLAGLFAQTPPPPPTQR